MSIAERIAAMVDDFVAVATCSTRGHDWRVWTVVGHEDIVSNPVCERCGRVDRPEDEA